MKIANYFETELMPVTMAGAKNTSMRVLIGNKDGAKNFVMRLFEVEKAGFTPYHNHNYEHEVFIVAGSGAVVSDHGEKPINAGNFLLVEPNEMHQFKNTGAEKLKFLCLIPAENSTF